MGARCCCLRDNNCSCVHLKNLSGRRRYCGPGCSSCAVGDESVYAGEEADSNSFLDVQNARTAQNKSGPIQIGQSQLPAACNNNDDDQTLSSENNKNANDKDGLADSGEKIPKVMDTGLQLGDEEDLCPTCLEEYDKENPKIITNCKHHFHLACILEWMERSDTCPICDQEMIFHETS